MIDSIDHIIEAENDFSQHYIQVRKKESRIYSDEEVKNLPEVDERNIHKKEWQIRAGSSGKLVKYFTNKNRPLSILEVGCGNGWLSNKLSKISNTFITGIDINELELEQAKRVFFKSNLNFINKQLDELYERFDVIIFAASIQYFPSLTNTLNTARKLLSTSGEIHILDSHFYHKDKNIAAKVRTDKYFNSIGYHQMSNYYFHHSLNELKSFSSTYLYKPNKIFSIFKNAKNPFPWLCIKK